MSKKVSSKVPSKTTAKAAAQSPVQKLQPKVAKVEDEVDIYDIIPEEEVDHPDETTSYYLIIMDYCDSEMTAWKLPGGRAHLSDDVLNTKYSMRETEEGRIFISGDIEADNDEDEEPKEYRRGSLEFALLNSIFDRKILHEQIDFPLILPEGGIVDYIEFVDY